MSNEFTQYVKILGRGKKGSRTLSEQEAYCAMSLILSNQVAPEQSGAFWMLIRIREETVEETVGFTRATREHLAAYSKGPSNIDLDWPAYAGKRNELPWFLLAAMALANHGIKVVMHGHEFEGEERIYLNSLVKELRLPLAGNPGAMSELVNEHNFCFIALSDVSAKLAELMDLKYLLGLRSPVNTVVRMMNPFSAKHSVHGVFHRGYDELHLLACQKLEDESVLVFRGGNGEAEVNPEREVTLGTWQQGRAKWSVWPKAEQHHKRLKDDLSLSRLRQHWSGVIIDPFGEQAVRQTLASVVGLLRGIDDQTLCLAMADNIWEKRDKSWIKETECHLKMPRSA
ncbi:glycosyl transferase family protein [Marinomonas epiphytica]